MGKRFPTIKVLWHKHRMLYYLIVPAQYSETGKRCYFYFANKEDAQKERARIMQHIQSLGASVSLLSPKQSLDSLQAYALLKEYGLPLSLRALAREYVDAKLALEDGMEELSLKGFAEDYAQARRELGGLDISLSEAARVALADHNRRNDSRLLSDLLNAYKAANQAEWREATARNFKFYSGKLDAKFGSAIASDITPLEMETWLHESFPSAQYLRSATSVLSPIWTWAEKRNIVPENIFEKIAKKKIRHEGDIDVLTVEETQTLLDSCRDFRKWKDNPFYDPNNPDADDRNLKLDCSNCLPAIALMTFAGIRPEEITRLTWEDILWEHGLIRISGEKTKTGSLRNVEINPTLNAWLQLTPASLRQGPVVSANWKRKWRLIRKAANISDRDDVCRHSYASYTLATNPDIARLMSNMGHSTRDMLLKHYRARVLPSEAEKFWTILPRSQQPDKTV